MTRVQISERAGFECQAQAARIFFWNFTGMEVDVLTVLSYSWFGGSRSLETFATSWHLPQPTLHDLMAAGANVM